MTRGNRRVLDVTHPPLWLVALVVAGAAPWFASALQAMFESKLRRRTDAVLARALAASGTRGPQGKGPSHPPRAPAEREGEEHAESETRRGSG
jgi:hypothetical protein